MFKKKPDQKTVVRAQKREVAKSQRELDREIQKLEVQEKKTTAECKAMAKKGQTASAKILAKEIIRIRHQKEKLYSARGQLSGVSTRMTTMQASGAVAKSMGQSAKVMGQMNRQTNMQQISRTMQEFDKQNQIAEMKAEMIDDVMDDGEVDDEADEEIEAVLAGLNLEVASQLTSAGSSELPSGAETVTDDDVEKYLATLNAV